MKIKTYLLSLFAFTQTACASTLNVDNKVTKYFAPLVSESVPVEKRRQSIIVGVVTPEGTRILSFGKLSSEKPVAPNETDIFEIGSITKGFVGLLLAKAQLENKLKLTDSVSQYTTLPVPQQIQFLHLANHTSSLPRLPNNLSGSKKDPYQPYLGYEVQHLENFLTHFKLEPSFEKKSEYSNLGAGLSGYVLESIYKKSLDDLIKEKITNVLNMPDTRIFLSAEQERRQVPEFMNNDPVPPWAWTKFSVLQGGGALKSNMKDMLVLLTAMINLNTQLTPAIQLATNFNFSTLPNGEIGLFWNKLKAENIIWHNGGTYGASSFIGYDPKRKIGIVVLSNNLILDEKSVDQSLDMAAFDSLLSL